MDIYFYKELKMNIGPSNIKKFGSTIDQSKTLWFRKQKQREGKW